MSAPDILALVAEAHEHVKKAEQLRKDTLAQRQAAIRAAHASGMTYRAIAKHLGMSQQRVHRAAEGNKPKRLRRAAVDL